MILRRGKQRLRGCLFGLFSAFQWKKPANRNKRVALGGGFAKAKAPYMQIPRSTYWGASRSFHLTAESFSTFAHFVSHYLPHTATAEPNRYLPPPVSFPIERPSRAAGRAPPSTIRRRCSVPSSGLARLTSRSAPLLLWIPSATFMLSGDGQRTRTCEHQALGRN
jgi:hypothetical protein